MNIITKKIVTALGLTACAFVTYSQTIQLTLDSCYHLARENYPLVKQFELIERTKDYTIDNLSKGYLPQVNLNSAATYQSTVTKFPIELANIKTPTYSKDQYRMYGEVSQLIFDGGQIRNEKKLQEAAALTDKQSLETELYKLNDRVNQLYFGIVLIDEQIKQNDLYEKDIQTGINKATASVNNGTALKSDLELLQAEMLKANQRTIELEASRKSYTDMLGLIIGKNLDEKTSFQMPLIIEATSEINRPELVLFNAQKNNIDVQKQLINSGNMPRVNLFLQGGYGRPGLNTLSNNFSSYYISGIRLTWSLSGFYTQRKEKALLDIQGNTIDLQRETFLLNTNINLKQDDGEISKLNQLLSTDDEIITLKTSVKKTALAQFENGVINSNDYLREVNAEDEARQNKVAHQIQLLLAEYNKQTTSGIKN